MNHETEAPEATESTPAEEAAAPPAEAAHEISAKAEEAPADANAEAAAAELVAEAALFEATPAIEAPIAEPEPESPAPTIQSIEPAHGPQAGGAALTITGAHFVEGCVVLVDGIESKTTFESATSLRVEPPPRAEAGAVDLVVKNPDGKSELRLRGYHYDPRPAISFVRPATVSSRGGTLLEIHGAHFVEGCAVRIGDKSISAALIGEGRLECAAPKLPAGEAAVAVTNPDGQSAEGGPSIRVADPPTITAITPAGCTIEGGAEVVISGDGFEDGVAVQLGAEPVYGVLRDGNTLRIVVPPARAPGAVDVEVLNPSGLADRRPAAFTYTAPAPTIEALTPIEGPNAGGTRVTVRGRHFAKGCVALLCGVDAPVTFRSSDEIEIVTPAVARDGLVELRVINPDDQRAVHADAFRYLAALPPPVLTAVSPNQAPQGGGIEVAILGDDFVEATAIRFGDVPAQVKFLTRKELKATAPPAAAAGAVTITAINPDGQSAALESAFTYEARPAPTLTSVSPQSGPTIGGTRVVLEGTNFSRDTFVYVGREHPKDIQVKSATEIHIVTAPRKAAGLVDIEVGSPGTAKSTLKNAFRFDAVPAPTLTSVSPNRGATKGGDEMTLTGTNFLKETLVLVDGKPVAKIKLVDKNTIEFKMPAGEANKMVDVAVRNPDGKEAVQKRAFLYDPRYG